MKPDELWDQFSGAEGLDGSRRMVKSDFLAALAEYGRFIRDRDAEICRNERLVDSTGLADDIAYNCAVNDCAAAIEKMEIK